MKERIATIGYFDGVHRGHRYLFEQMRRIADKERLCPTIYTFYEHPKKVLTGECPPLLSPGAERYALLEREGEVRYMDFCEVRGLTAQEFMQRLHNEGVSTLLMGYDHRFGSDRLANYEAYAAAGKAAGLCVMRAEELEDPQTGHISSSRIRARLADGDAEGANAMLGYAYTLRGEVVHGNAIGRTLGFPTANIRCAEDKLLPPAGVYAGRCTTGGSDYPTLVNIGTNPTVGNAHLSVEGHIVGYKGDLYGETVGFRIERFLRKEQKFSSLEELKEQLKRDYSML